MIDTLHLMFEPIQFELGRTPLLKQYRSFKRTRLSRRESAAWRQNIQLGVVERYERKEGPFTVVIKSMNQNFSSPNCSLYFSVPKTVRGGNVFPVDLADTKVAIHQAQIFLNETGIIAEVKNAKITRIDLFKNVETSEPVSSYWPICEWNQMRRKRTENYPGTGLIHKNKSMQLAIYDKIRERQDNDESVDHLPQNLLRYELRFMKAQKIRNVLGTSVLGELIENYNDLNSAFRSSLYEQQFKFRLREEPERGAAANLTCLSGSNDAAPDMDAIQYLYGSKWLNGWREIRLWSSMNQVERDALLNQMAMQRGPSAVTRLKKRMWEADFASTLLLRVDGTDKILACLYQELRDKVIGDFQPQAKKRGKTVARVTSH